jgi:hypothetical protein
MSDVVYVSKSRIVRRQGPLRIAHLPGESQPVIYSVHGGIAEHYKGLSYRGGERYKPWRFFMLCRTRWDVFPTCSRT